MQPGSECKDGPRVPPIAGLGGGVALVLPAACSVIVRSRALHDVRGEPHRVVLSDAAERSRFPTPPGDGRAPVVSRFGAVSCSRMEGRGCPGTPGR